MEELKKQIEELQAQMSIAIETDDLVHAHELETQIDLLQNQLIRLKGE